MMRRFIVIAMALVATLIMLAEDVTFMNNRRQWEALPSATLIKIGQKYMNVKHLPDSALLCYSIIANRYNENLEGEELKCTIRANCWIGNIYVDYYVNYTEGYKYLLKAQDLAEKHHYDDFLPVILNILGNFYWLQEGLRPGDQCYKEALACHKKSFWKTLEIKKYDEIPADLINLIYIAFVKGELMQITKEREAYRHLPIPDTSELKFAAQAMYEGVELFSGGHMERALETFRHALDKDKTTSPHNTLSLQVMFDMYIYKTLLCMGRDNDALSILQQGRDVVQNNLPNQISGIYKEFAEYYRRQHNQAMADRYELLWRRSVDSIAQACGANSLNTVRFLHEIDKMNEEVKVLTYKEHTKERILWMVAAFALIALLLLVLLYISRRRIREGYRRLYQQNVELLAADEVRRQTMEAEPAPVAKYSHNQMDEDVMDELWLQIKRVMETSEEIYHDPFGVDQLADLLGAKRNYVSQTINTKTGEAFPALLNEYRIREACRRMNDLENYGNYSVEGIAQSVGYNSRSHFAKLFKAATGVPPSAYMKMCKAGTPPGAPTPS